MGLPPAPSHRDADPGLRRLSVALRNLRRSLFRSFAIGAAMALLTGSLLAIAATLLVVQLGVARGTGKLGADMVVVPLGAPDSPAPEAAPHYLDYSTVKKVSEVQVIVPQYGGRPAKRVPGVAAVSAQLSLWLQDPPWAEGGPVQLVGFEPDSDLTVLAWLPGGLARPLASRDALVGHAWAKLDNHDIELAGDRFRVAGVLDRTEAEDTDRSIFVPLPVVWELARRIGAGRPPDGAISRVMVRSDPAVEPQRTANFIRTSLPGVDPRLLDTGLAALGTQLRVSVDDLVLIAAAIWVTALLLVGSASSMVIRERQRELGLLRAMGATRGGVLGMLALEILPVCLAGGVIGVVLAVTALAVMGDAVGRLFGSPWAWPGGGRMLTLGLLCILAAPATGLLAALGPALRAVMLEPHAAIQDTP